MIRTYPTNHPGAFSLECSTAGHGRCRSVACECWCHHTTVDDVVEAYERQLAIFIPEIREIEGS